MLGLDQGSREGSLLKRLVAAATGIGAPWSLRCRLNSIPDGTKISQTSQCPGYLGIKKDNAAVL